VDNPLVNPIRPVISQNLDITFTFKRPASHRYQPLPIPIPVSNPPQPLPQNKPLHTLTAIPPILSQRIIKLQIPSQQRRKPLEFIEFVLRYPGFYGGPRVDGVFFVWDAEDVLVFGGEVEEEGGTGCGAEGGGNVYLPVGEFGGGRWVWGWDGGWGWIVVGFGAVGGVVGLGCVVVEWWVGHCFYY